MSATNFIHAKRIVDFYIDKLKDEMTPQAQFALQYAHLKLMKFRAQATVNSLTSYPIKREE